MEGRFVTVCCLHFWCSLTKRLVTQLYVTYFFGAHTPIVAIPYVDAMLYVTHILCVHTPEMASVVEAAVLYVTHILCVHTPWYI